MAGSLARLAIPTEQVVWLVSTFACNIYYLQSETNFLLIYPSGDKKITDPLLHRLRIFSCTLLIEVRAERELTPEFSFRS